MSEVELREPVPGEHLWLWEQPSLLEGDFTVEANRADLVDFEQRHAAGRACTYTVLHAVPPEPVAQSPA